MTNRYLITTTETYRVPTVEEVKRIHDEMLHSDIYELVSFTYKTKYIKSSDEEYQLVTAKLKFQDEKDPVYIINSDYQIAGNVSFTIVGGEEE